MGTDFSVSGAGGILEAGLSRSFGLDVEDGHSTYLGFDFELKCLM